MFLCRSSAMLRLASMLPKPDSQTNSRIHTLTHTLTVSEFGLLEHSKPF